jgi:hypothetical protein
MSISIVQLVHDVPALLCRSTTFTVIPSRGPCARNFRRSLAAQQARLAAFGRGFDRHHSAAKPLPGLGKAVDRRVVATGRCRQPASSCLGKPGVKRASAAGTPWGNAKNLDFPAESGCEPAGAAQQDEILTKMPRI